MNLHPAIQNRFTALWAGLLILVFGDRCCRDRLQGDSQISVQRLRFQIIVWLMQSNTALRSAVKVGDLGGNISGILRLPFHVNTSMASPTIILSPNPETSTDSRDIKGWLATSLSCIDLEILSEFVSIWEESCPEQQRQCSYFCNNRCNRVIADNYSSARRPYIVARKY